MADVGQISWSPLLESDIERLDEIARHIHPTLPERPEIFAEKRALFPQGCFRLTFAGTMMGYAVSHPWMLNSIPPVDEFLKQLPPKPDCIYVHDVAVLPEARGHNAAGTFVEIIKKVALQMNIQKLSCVSVYGTDVLWSRFGFRAIESAEIVAKLSSYGSTAKYMVADIPEHI